MSIHNLTDAFNGAVILNIIQELEESNSNITNMATPQVNYQLLNPEMHIVANWQVKYYSGK